MERIFETLSAYKDSISNDNGLVKPPTDKIWTEISSVFGIGNVSTKYIYTICKMNRGNILGKLNILPSLNQNNDYVSSEIDSESDVDNYE